MTILIYIVGCILGAAVYYALYPWMLYLVKKVDERIIEDAYEEEQFLLENDFLLQRKQEKQIVFAVFGGVVALGLLLYYGATWKAVTVFAFYAVLSLITLIDFVRMEIPFVLNLIIFVIGLVSIVTMGEISITSRLIGMMCISVPMELIVEFVPGGFGGGDIKLMRYAGMLLGAGSMVVGFFVGVVIGGLYGIIMLLRRKKGKKDQFAFGPCLSLGLMVAAVCGNQIMQMYLSTFTNNPR